MKLHFKKTCWKCFTIIFEAGISSWPSWDILTFHLKNTCSSLRYMKNKHHSITFSGRWKYIFHESDVLSLFLLSQTKCLSFRWNQIVPKFFVWNRGTNSDVFFSKKRGTNADMKFCVGDQLGNTEFWIAFLRLKYPVLVCHNSSDLRKLYSILRSFLNSLL